MGQGCISLIQVGGDEEGAVGAAGIPASQLLASPGEIRKKEGNMSATFILKNQ